ncbi:hypothetical protein D9M68_945790 [compost metagenome]
MHAVFTGGRFLDAHWIIIQRDIDLLLVVEKTADGLAYATVSANHHMVAQARIECADLFEFRFFIGLAVQTHRNVWCGAQQ